MTTQVGYVIEMTFLLFKLIEYIYKKIKYTNTVIFFFLCSGLDPSWYLQHVTVWDMQTDNMFFFLVEDWLSVENEKNSGLVQKVVLATCKS